MSGGGTVRGPGFGGPGRAAEKPTSIDGGPPSPPADATVPMDAPFPGVSAAVASMYLDDADLQPPSLLVNGRLDARELVAGLGGVVGIPLAVVLFWVAYLLLQALGILRALAWLAAAIVALLASYFGTASATERALERPLPEIENVIAARFVILGEEIDPRLLPNRIVPILRTDTPEPRDAPSLREDPEPPPPRERRERDRRAADDMIRRLSDDAQIFAEREEARIREGSPDGIEEGTERHGTEGDLYRGRLYTFFRRGWTVPTTLSESDLSGLQCVVMVEVGLDTRIVGWRLSRRSGNAEFDASVEAQLTRVTASDSNIPAPPDDVADQYLGREIAIRFSGRDARR